MVTVTINDEKFEDPITYHLDDRLKKNLDDNVKPALMENDEDYFIVIDGGEGTGKSTLGMQIGKYIDPSLDLTRVVFNAESFREAIYKAKKGEVIIFDEAFVGLSSRAALSGINRVLVSLMMQMRQKNLCIILILPTFYLLDKYAAIWRCKVLIHVYKNKKRKGYFMVFPKHHKKMLYLTGKKDYSYKVRTDFKGRFYGKFALGDDDYELKYRKKKAVALEDTEKSPMSAGQVKYKEQRDILLFLLRKNTEMTYQQLDNYLQDYD